MLRRLTCAAAFFLQWRFKAGVKRGRGQSPCKADILVCGVCSAPIRAISFIRAASRIIASQKTNARGSQGACFLATQRRTEEAPKKFRDFSSLIALLYTLDNEPAPVFQP